MIERTRHRVSVLRTGPLAAATAAVWAAFATIAPAGEADSAAETAAVTVESLYGAKLKQVESTPAIDDDAALAGVIFEDARLRDPRSPLRGPLCEKAYELGAKGKAGYAAAAEAMKLLADASPKRADECWQKTDLLLRRRYSSARGVFPRLEAGEHMVISMLQRAVQLAEGGQFSDASILLRRASPVARTIRSGDYAGILSMQKYLGSRMRFVRRSADLLARLKADPADADARAKLIRVYTIELDDPARAAGLLTAEIDEAARTYVPLAARPAAELSPDVCGELGQWYRGQTDGASSEGRMVAWGRAARYLEIFIASREKAGVAKMKAQLALEEIRQRLAMYKAHYPVREVLSPLRADLLAHGRARNRLTPSFQLQVLKKRLKETNGGAKTAFRFHLDPSTNKIVSARVRSDRSLISLDALAALQIGQLSIENCPKFRGDLAALAGMPLDDLDLSDCSSLRSLHGLEQMRLTRLTLNGCSSLCSLSPLRRTPLKQLSAMSCSALTSLDGLQDVPLTSLNLQGCSGLAGDLTPLRNSKLTRLDLADCRRLALKGIEDLPLKHVDVTGCDGLSAPEYERIKQVTTLESMKADSEDLALGILRAIVEARAKKQAEGAGGP